MGNPPSSNNQTTIQNQNKMEKQLILKITYIIDAVSYEATFLVYENDRLEKMLPPQAIIVSVIELK